MHSPTPPNNIPLLMGLTTCPLRRLLSGRHGASSHRGEGRDSVYIPIHRIPFVSGLSRAIHPIHPIHLYILYIYTSYTLYIPIHSPSASNTAVVGRNPRFFRHYSSPEVGTRVFRASVAHGSVFASLASIFIHMDFQHTDEP